MATANGKHVILVVGLVKGLILILCGFYLLFLAIQAPPSRKGATPGYWRVAVFSTVATAFTDAILNEVTRWD